MEGSIWTARAIDNYTYEVSLPAPRGIIYDRNGFILARNLASYNIVITPAGLPQDESDIQRIYRELSDLIDIPVGGPVTEASLQEAKLFAACVEGPGIAQLVALQDTLAPYSPVKVKCNLSEQIARIVEEKSVDWLGASRGGTDTGLSNRLAHSPSDRVLGTIPASQEAELPRRIYSKSRQGRLLGVEASLRIFSPVERIAGEPN